MMIRLIHHSGSSIHSFIFWSGINFLSKNKLLSVLTGERKEEFFFSFRKPAGIYHDFFRSFVLAKRIKVNFFLGENFYFPNLWLLLLSTFTHHINNFFLFIAWGLGCFWRSIEKFDLFPCEICKFFSIIFPKKEEEKFHKFCYISLFLFNNYLRNCNIIPLKKLKTKMIFAHKQNDDDHNSSCDDDYDEKNIVYNLHIEYMNDPSIHLSLFVVGSILFCFNHVIIHFALTTKKKTIHFWWWKYSYSLLVDFVFSLKQKR